VVRRRPATSFPYIFRTSEGAREATMARTVRNAKLDKRSARLGVAVRREPHWTVVSQGCGLGYRRGVKGGTWIARFRDDTGRQHYQAIGAADDARDPDGITMFSFAQAQEKARTFFGLIIAESRATKSRYWRWPRRRSCPSRTSFGLHVSWPHRSTLATLDRR
jgi:hypothetical protein